MLKHTSGIVLRRMKYSDTSLICKIFTSDLGLKTYIIKGVRSSRSKQKGALLHPMNILDMVVYDREGKQMQMIKEYKSAHVFSSLLYDTLKSSVGIFIMEVLSKSIKEGEENGELFDFASRSIQFLDRTELPIANLHVFFLVKLTDYLGLKPFENHGAEKPYFDMVNGEFVAQPVDFPMDLGEKCSGLLAKILAAESYDAILELGIGKKERNRLLKGLLRYYEYHIEQFKNIQSMRVLEEVLGD